MKLPTVADNFMREVFRILEREDRLNRKVNQDVEISNNELILTSPNGTRYAIRVDDNGNLTSTTL